MRIADDVLFPAAAAVDSADVVPRSQLDALAGAGFYGIAAPVAEGGVGPEAADADGFEVMCDGVAALAGGCLATTFVWLQHLGPVMSVAACPIPGIREAWLRPLARGERRAGVAQAGVRPGPARVHIARVAGGFLVRGETAWVTGWV